jgi:DNA-binding response OmpR family regulator
LPKILVVDDDPGIRVLMVRALRENGMEAVGAGDSGEMWRMLDQSPYDLVLLDVMLPGASGLDICRQLRAKSQMRIIMVSARGEEIDRVLGLELGADDYLAKPIGHKELLARVRAVLRRGPITAEFGSQRKDMMKFRGWQLDLRGRTLTAPSGARVELSGAEHDLLVSFLENAQRVIGRDRLLELSRSRLGDVSDRSIDVLVSRLRRKLEEEGEDADPLIRTVRGVGYMFAAPVERL